MSRSFEELDYRPTPIGDLSLRRRRDLALDVDVIEIKLGDEFLMSDLFTASEIALADLALARFQSGNLDVLVGGLGLGYTAQAVLKAKHVESLLVVDAMDAVIDWHESGLLPLGSELTSDPRCRFQLGDFFALSETNDGFDALQIGRRFDAILVDIDHSPEFLLDPDNRRFYQPEGLLQLSTHLKANGVFGLWSNDLPSKEFLERLNGIFSNVSAEEVRFHNPIQRKEFIQTVYLAEKSPAP